jgi:penicillin amidase
MKGKFFILTSIATPFSAPMRFLRWSAIVLALLVVATALAAYFALRSSLPQLDGEIAVAGIGRPAAIERDADGVPTIRAASRRDLAYATGFAHAQDRFFQMDLQRRAAAGELAELLGAGLLDTDRQLRSHAFRRVAQQVIADASAADRAILDAYTAGVNEGVDRSRARPWEYLLLRSTPRRWLPEDSILAAFSMYLSLSDSSGAAELARAELHESLPPQLFAFMHPLGTEWDAPIAGGTWRAPPVPGPEVIDLRQPAARAASLAQPPSTLQLEEEQFAGSNSWVVAGSHSANGAALLANDMHLGLRLPHVWYRARLIVTSGPEARDLVGVTLPGLPMLMVGSNGKVAWGYTNSHGDWTDLVIVETDPQHADRYFAGDGSEPFQVRHETIQVRNESPVQYDVRATRWGPIVRNDAAGRPLALAWTAHDPRATNLRMLDFESAGTVGELLDAANRAGGPVQNIVAADAQGHIGWSLMGQLPMRANYDSTMPASWRAAGTGWTGWRTPAEYPRVVDPAAGRIWTANTRTIDAETWLAFLGDGDPDIGARAAQIRDGLLALKSATATDLVKIQLDDRALFLARWRDLLLDLLNHDAVASHASRRQARDLVEKWSAHAAANDVGYRIVRAFRLQVRKDVFDTLTASARARYPQTTFSPSAQFEGALWQLVTQRPLHLLDPRYPRWEDGLLASLDATVSTLVKECGDLADCTWGRQNTLSMRHPLSPALPFAARWLDMPDAQIPGDSAMPRVQAPQFGASERLVVSPGKEAGGYFQMPGGPVDHPLSPFYGAGHDAWVRGESLPLLPGATKYTLQLRPASGSRR